MFAVHGPNTVWVVPPVPKLISFDLKIVHINCIAYFFVNWNKMQSVLAIYCNRAGCNSIFFVHQSGFTLLSEPQRDRVSPNELNEPHRALGTQNSMQCVQPFIELLASRLQLTIDRRANNAMNLLSILLELMGVSYMWKEL